jgi:peptidoglycan/LPS O-acetylase OafA/YrhL
MPIQSGMARPRVGSGSNNFDVLRLGAAALVFLSHGFLVNGVDDPAIALTGDETLGDIAVTAFFGISGFLVARSWCRDPRLGRFVTKRALRIVPALWAVIALSALVLGPLFTTRPVGAYFASSEPWQYLAGNGTFRTALYLPGVFTGNPHDAVNGSLWTLPLELEAYLAVALLGVVGVFRRAGAVAAAAVALLVLDLPFGPAGHALVTAGGSSSLAEDTVNRLAAFFVAALIYVLRDREIVTVRGLAVVGTAWIASIGTSFEYVVGAVAIPYAVVLAAYRTPAGLGRLAARGDVSYGVYLWGWPVQQAVRALLGPGVGVVGTLMVAAPLTYVVALASWRLVESPALGLKDRPGWRSRPAAAAARA